MARLALVLSFLVGGFCYGQTEFTTLVAPAGGSYEGNSFKTVWTLGELTGGTASANGVQVHHGFIQPKILFTITAVEEDSSPSLFNIYPNPANEFLFIKWNTVYSSTGIKFRLYNSRGLLMDTIEPQSVSELQKLDISNYAPGVYLLTIEGDNLQKTHKLKIIKTYTDE